MTARTFFAGKADSYTRYRIDYPEALIAAAFSAVHLAPEDVVADLGSGTGLLTRWLLDRSTHVFGVEPEPDMREAAVRGLEPFGARFTSVPGSAEATTLPDASVDVVTAGNAFHYFDPTRARVECARILRPGGRILILWHDAASHPNRFMSAYRTFLEGIADPRLWQYQQAERMDRALELFFGDWSSWKGAGGDSRHPLSWDALLGRFLSTSLAPPETDPRRPQIVAGLREVFDECQQAGTVELELSWRFQWGGP
jgi:SAM-dependent methyltransferase